MDEEWAAIHEFPNYIVSTHGRVANEITKRLIKPNHTTQGALKVGLIKNNQQYTRSVKLLVATAFVKRESEDFDTPIHVDGNQDNVRADNLMWRPRWFAWKYARQFINCDEYKQHGLYLHPKSSTLYESIYEIGVTYGVLFKDVIDHIWDGTPLFPIYEEFIFAR